MNSLFSLSGFCRSYLAEIAFVATSFFFCTSGLFHGSPRDVEFTQSARNVDNYDFVVITLNVKSPDVKNPFVETTVEGWFAIEDGRKVPVDGFCDSADGHLFRIRFMPTEPGHYQYSVRHRQGSYKRSYKGKFTAIDAGPVPVNLQGIMCLASLGIRKLTVVGIEGQKRGKTLAQHLWRTAYACNIITPAVTDNKVILSSGHDVGRTALFQVSGDKVRQLWSIRYWSEGCSPVIHKGCIYLVIGQVHCLNLSNGKLKWRGGRFGRDSSCLVTCDDKLLVFGSRDLGLVEASPTRNKYRELTRVRDVIGGTCYPHLALADGILAAKNKEGDVVCLSVRPR